MRDALLAMLEQHVLLGERHIARQREIVADFHRKGLRSDIAEELLSTGIAFEIVPLLTVLSGGHMSSSMPSR